MTARRETAPIPVDLSRRAASPLGLSALRGSVCPHSCISRCKEALDSVNRDRGSLLGAFEVQAGLDEFAGVVRLGHVSTVLPRLWEDLHPVEIRYAVVKGTLDVIPEPGVAEALPGAAGFDGPVLLYGRLLAWTERQLEVARVYRRRGSQEAAARELGVGQSTVSRTLSAADYPRVEAALGTFAETLDKISQECSDDT